MKTALITGISGQDGSYLAELLLSKGYEVHGLLRRTAVEPDNHRHLIGKVNLHYGDVCTDNHLCYLVHDLQTDEVYNLAAQSDVHVSFECPEYTGDATGLGVLRVLEALRHFSPRTRFYQASTSELFGDSPPPQNEESCMNPRSPYGVAKKYGYDITRVYRDAFGLFACNGILFNHESERRGTNFVTRKISRGVAAIYYHRQSELLLGNLDTERDWGYAPDYVKAAWLMLQQDKPDDYVVGTGEVHTVREFCDLAFKCVNLDYRDFVKVSAQNMRPLEVSHLCSNPAKARSMLGWQPVVLFPQLVERMVEHDLREASIVT